MKIEKYEAKEGYRQSLKSHKRKERNEIRNEQIASNTNAFRLRSY